MTSLPFLPALEADNRLRGLWRSDGLDQVESRLIALVTGEGMSSSSPLFRVYPSDPLGAIVTDHLSTGGKRLRARLALGVVEVLGGDRAAAAGWAAACELLHNASLIHDDVQDGDRLRRGRPAVWAAHGVAQAINAGDLCLMLPYSAIDEVVASADVKFDLCLALARQAERMVRGQAGELDLLGRRRLDWASYVQCVEGKTASLFALPVEGAARIAGRSRAQSAAIAREFRHVGVLFQIQDDLLDLWGDKGRGEAGSDLKEGKVSALVVEHLRLHPADRAWLVDLLETPRSETSDADVAEAIRRFEAGGALEAVWERLTHLEDQVVSSPLLELEPRLHALAIELVALALAPVAHTAPRRIG